jgi:hypothetical protein
MKQIKMENLIKGLQAQTHVPHPRIKSEVMAYVLANGFHRANIFALRYAVGFAMLLLFGAGGTVFAAQRAQPGQVLYPVKRVSESAYVNIQPTSAAKVSINEALIQRRINEADKFVDNDNDDDSGNGGEDIDVKLAVDERLVDDTAKESDAWVDAQEHVFSLTIERDRDPEFDRDANTGRKRGR